MAYFKLYYHVIWAVCDRAPLLTPDVETVVLHAIRHKSTEMDCIVHAVNGATDHLHVAVTIPPKVAIAEWIRQVKGLSTREANAFYPDLEMPLAWQSSYGALSFGAKHLSTVVAYVVNQKTHHAEGGLIDYLERDEE